MNDFKSILKKASMLYEKSSVEKSSKDKNQNSELIFINNNYAFTQKEIEEYKNKISTTKIKI